MFQETFVVFHASLRTIGFLGSAKLDTTYAGPRMEVPEVMADAPYAYIGDPAKLHVESPKKFSLNPETINDGH